MTTRLEDRLAAARRSRFVGRQAELELVAGALAEPESTFAVLYVYGPGGVGKTALLREMAEMARRHGRSVILLDGRNLEPQPAAFRAALQTSYGAGQSLADTVILVDTYELLTPLDLWLRTSFLPQLSAQTLVVLAGRAAPANAWREEAGWSVLTRIVSLENLPADACRQYLTARNVPPQHHAAILDFTRGHPLALSLLADLHERQQPVGPLIPVQSPDVIQALVTRFVEDVPTTQQRAALELCAIARSTNEALLAFYFGGESAYSLFQWLRNLSFVEQGPYGVFPHDLVRDVISSDLQWRNPTAFAAYQQSILTYLQQQGWQSQGIEQQRYGLDMIFVNRQAPGMQAFFAWDELDAAYAEAATPADFPAILEMVRRHEGVDSADIAHHWQQRQPYAFLAYRKGNGELYGFMVQLDLHLVDNEDCTIDPAVTAALAYVRERQSIEPGQAISYMRFWMADETYQAVSPAVNLSAANCVIHWRTTPNLVWSFVAMAFPDFMAPHFESVRFSRTHAADFTVGERTYGVFSHNWIQDPIAQWLVDTKHAGAALTPSSGLSSVQTVALSEAEFAHAVRQALRDFTRPDLLATNPLLSAHLLPIRERTPTALQALVQEAVDKLRHNPKDAKLYRALWHTYIEPEPSQEKAAEFLDLPFNTYRYHLNAGIARVVAALWQLEIARR